MLTGDDDGDLGPRERATSRRWVAALLLPLLVAAEWELRRRGDAAAVSGAPDWAVLLEIAVFLGVGALLVLGLRPRRSPRTRVPQLLVLLWVVVGVQAVSAVWSPYPSLSVVRAAQLLVVAGLAHAVATRATREALHVAMHGLLVLTLVAVGLGLALDFPAYTILQEGRFTWLYVHPVQAGVWFSVALVVAVAYAATSGVARSGPRWSRAAYALVALVFLTSLLATLARGAVAAGLLGSVVVLWAGAPRSRRVDLLAALALASSTLVAVLGGRLLEAAARGQSAEELATLNYRTRLWGLAADRLAEHPLFGYGLGASRGLFLEETGLGGGHNAFVDLAVNSGLVGLLLSLALVGATAVTLRRLPRADPAVRADRPLLAGLLVALVVSGTTNESVGAPATMAGALLLVVVAWTSVLRRGTAS